MKQPVVLRIYRGEKLETVRQFEHSQIVIGRNADCQLELQDESIALLHAMIEDRDGEYYVSDLGSQSGTFKAGNRVLEERLSSGDELKIGPFRIQFFIGIPKPAAPPKISATPAAPTPPPAAVSFTSVIPRASPALSQCLSP
ncbi:MAG: FHA domain-containing protein [Calothrix sp. SM1_5_4]|nr:FHA domain-containing protein [Calothrix sp. SM1_5_4]